MSTLPIRLGNCRVYPPEIGQCEGVPGGCPYQRVGVPIKRVGGGCPYQRVGVPIKRPSKGWVSPSKGWVSHRCHSWVSPSKGGCPYQKASPSKLACRRGSHQMRACPGHKIPSRVLRVGKPRGRVLANGGWWASEAVCEGAALRRNRSWGWAQRLVCVAYLAGGGQWLVLVALEASAHAAAIWRTGRKPDELSVLGPARALVGAPISAPHQKGGCPYQSGCPHQKGGCPHQGALRCHSPHQGWVSEASPSKEASP